MGTFPKETACDHADWVMTLAMGAKPAAIGSAGTRVRPERGGRPALLAIYEVAAAPGVFDTPGGWPAVHEVAGYIVGAVLLAAALIGCANPFAVPEPKTWPGPVVTGACTAELLPLPAGRRSNRHDRDHGHGSHRRYLVGYQTIELRPMPTIGSILRQRPILWDDGVPRMLDIPGTYGSVIAVSSRGCVLGAAEDMTSPGWVFMPESGTVVALEGALPVDMNERGEIARLGEAAVETAGLGEPA